MTAVTATATPHHGGALTGTGSLLGLMLRRDRIWLAGWVIGLTLLLAYFVNALAYVVDADALEGLASLASNPVMVLVSGPGYGFDQITLARFIVGIYGVYLMIGAALMSILTVSRHTRLEEQTGRAELVQAAAIGRHARLAAALVLTTLMNVALAFLMAPVFYFSPVGPGSLAPVLLFTVSIGAVGVVFAAVAAVTVQLSPYSRAASGIAGAVLAVTFVLRGLGDMSHSRAGGLGWLSWVSPFGWSQQTAPLTLDRWWPLTIALVVSLVLALVGFALQDRRDLAAGVLPDRLGRAEAPSWLQGPAALAFRLQRSALAWWSFALFIAGIVFGAFVQPMTQNADGMPQELQVLLGSPEGMVKGYLGFMGLYFAIFTSVFVILAVQGLKGEETDLRAESILATGVSRSRWSTAWLGITALGCLWLLLIGGLGEGLGASMAMKDGSLFKQVVIGHVIHAPAPWVLLGLAALFYGWAPRLLGLTWAAFLVSAGLALFGELLRLGDTVLAISVYRHIGEYPAADISWTAVTVLTLLAVVLATLGVAGFRRRDVTAT